MKSLDDSVELCTDRWIFSAEAFDHIADSSKPCSGAFDEIALRLTPSFPLGMDSGQYPNGVKGLEHVKGLDQWHGLMVARMSSSSRWRGERYIPKNVSFLRLEQVLATDGIDSHERFKNL